MAVSRWMVRVGTDECPFCHRMLYSGESCTCSGWISSSIGGGGSSHPPGSSFGGGSSAKQNDTQYKVLIERLRYLLSIWVNKISLIESNINKLMQGGIFIPDEKVSNPIYNLKDNKIHIPIDESLFSMETVNHEALHYFQNQQQMLDYDMCSSNAEFQAYIINYLGSAELFFCPKLRIADVPPHSDNGDVNSPYMKFKLLAYLCDIVGHNDPCSSDEEVNAGIKVVVALYLYVMAYSITALEMAGRDVDSVAEGTPYKLTEDNGEHYAFAAEEFHKE